MLTPHALRFTEDLVALSAHLGLRLAVAHSPPYTSTEHPIEHRLSSQVELSFSGVILDSPRPALQAYSTPAPRPGSTVKARLLDTVYERGRKCSATFDATKDNFNHHDSILGKLDYVVDANGFS